MVVDRKITGEPTEVESESVTIDTPDESLTVENIEMTARIKFRYELSKPF